MTLTPLSSCSGQSQPARRACRSIARALALLGAVGAGLSLLAARPAQAAQEAPAAGCPATLQHTAARLQDGKPQNLCQFAGQVVLVVNTASYCGYTPQFKGLEALNAQYASKGLVVLGFPSNDFRQEDADAGKTADVCFNTYGVQFPMFATGVVKGAKAQPLFQQLARATGQQPSWNFNKYLIGRDGQPIAHYPSKVTPQSPELVQAIERALAAR